MEIQLKGINFSADCYDVKDEFARILHSNFFGQYNASSSTDFNDVKDGLARIPHSDFFEQYNASPGQERRPMNFHIELGESTNGNHDGTGILVVPTRKIGKELLRLVRQRIVVPSVNYRRIRVEDSGRDPNRSLIETVRKLPYQDPGIERERNDILYELSVSWRIEKLQFGIWLPRPSPHRGKRKFVFAVEWEKDYVAEDNAQLEFDYDHKLIRLCLGDPFMVQEVHYVLIKFATIQHLWVGHEIRPYICFDLITPPIFESQFIHQTKTGIAAIDKRKTRQRVDALDEYHRRIAPFAFQVRVSLYRQEDLDAFIRSCAIAGLQYPMPVAIISEKHNFFSSKRLSELQRAFPVFRELSWTVIFQIESLLYNGLLTPIQLLKGLLPHLESLAKAHPDIVAIVLRDYSQTLIIGSQDCVEPSDVAQNFQRFCSFRLESALLESAALKKPEDHESEGYMACHHVTFTVTRMLLEGPYVIRSNRILRRYSGFHDHFLRVDFREEDRLQFRWDREVDGTTLLEQRVGGTLKNGFVLGGRQFEFLAYSSSSLREHSVWFVSPFIHPEKGLVNAASIRKGVGDLSAEFGYPAKFAARLALAFSGTNPSVKIHRTQWTKIDDLGTKPYLHTDGVGTISRELGRMIWAEQCRMNPTLRQYAEPSAYQIRFLGFKGVVVIDFNLEGVQMCLRGSMEKFKTHDVEIADIEIANSFYTPTALYLNQPLVMILEDRGVKIKAFMDLLELTIADTHLARDSMNHFISVMKSHGLGATFGLTSLLQKLSSYKLDFKTQNPSRDLRSPFIDKLINTTIARVLRDVQFRCRIPVPKSHTLVGVADEGPAYIERGRYSEHEVYTLDKDDIYACIKKDADSEPEYLDGRCIIFRSPTLYAGDVRHVFAIGKPPPDKFCAFRDLVNVVVFPSKGARSLASCLSGGDLDGDIFSICQYQPLFGNIFDEPAEFRPVQSDPIDLSKLKDVDPDTGRIHIDQEKIIPYVTDFIVKYINSDLMGILADRHLIRADQSAYGVRDRGCVELAKLCNQAVDYPKHGKQVDISKLPQILIPYKPDWKKKEADDERRTDFYRSERAIGQIFRRVEQFTSRSDFAEDRECAYAPVSQHPIYAALKTPVEGWLRNPTIQKTTEDDVRRIFRRYSYELSYICATHTLADHIDARLKEEEVVLGTILARCSRHRWRTERIYRMRVHASNLVKETREKFMPGKLRDMTVREVLQALEFAWTSWRLITDKLSTEEARKNSFGLNSFSIIALNIVLECLGHLDGGKH